MISLLRLIRNKFVYENEKLVITFNNLVYRFMKCPKIKSIDDTIDTIIERRASISRYGDGEFDIIFGRKQGFQAINPVLGRRLREILRCNNESSSFLVALPDCFEKLDHFTPNAQLHWMIRLQKERYKWYKLLNRKDPYYHAQISRFYLDWVDKSQASKWVAKLKKVWEGRNLLIVEGNKSRLGVGNDLFDGALIVRRVLCPSVNAFDKYEDIIYQIQNFASKDDLILLALGPTATVLAYDLYKLGFQALDIGHIDIEYEWMKMGVTQKERIVGRFMNEIDNGAFVDESFDHTKYLSEIIYIIK